MVEDRPRDQVRKVGHEQRVVRQGVTRDLATIRIHQERDLGEGVEGDADRQQDVDRNMRTGQRIDVLGDEAGIFEDAEHQEVADDAERERRLSLHWGELRRDQEIADAVVEGDRDQQQAHELPAAEGVEGERGQRQPDHRRQIAAPPEPEIAGQHGRQEQQDERVGIEQHQAGPAAGGIAPKAYKGAINNPATWRSPWRSGAGNSRNRDDIRWNTASDAARLSSPSPRSYGER
ncbi:hypothetical protein [Bradyrhizobium sp. RT4b]|uniref:hypothetical protein n=1 Tax=unclassified Bradyrhizobium TaxID=2631580 RepID=UPI0033911461